MDGELSAPHSRCLGSSLLARLHGPEETQGGLVGEMAKLRVDLPYSLLPPFPFPILLPLQGFLPVYFHHVIQPPLFFIQFLSYLLLLQDLSIPDCVALGIQNNLGGWGERILTPGSGIRLRMEVL